MKRLYYIDGDCGDRFETLREVRNHILIHTETDKRNYEGAEVYEDWSGKFMGYVRNRGAKVIISKKIINP